MIDLNRNLITINDNFVPLTKRISDSVTAGDLQRRGTEQAYFISHIYGGIDEQDSKIIDVFICKLRRKLDEWGKRRQKLKLSGGKAICW